MTCQPDSFQCVILAGGLGTRLGERTRRVPKTLVEVAGRPFAALQLQMLANQGIRRVVYCIGHLGEMVQEFVGDGSDWGLTVDYARDPEPLVGTAGALRLAFDQGQLDDTFLVMFGDSYLTIDLAAMQRQFKRGRAAAMMAVYRNENRWDKSNVVLRGDMVAVYDKSADPQPEDMVYIDYGISIMTSAALVDGVQPGEPADLSPLMSALAAAGRLAAFEATERFYEIGSPSGLAELEGRLAR